MIKNIVGYLVGTKDYRNVLPKQSKKVEVLCWKDANWDRDLFNRRAHTGVLIITNDGPVVWTS